MANRWGNSGNRVRLYFWGAPKSLQMVIAAMKLKKCLLLGRKVMTNLDSILKSQRHFLVNKRSSSQGYDFSSNHVWMWELDYKAERRRIDAFELWCWRRLLRVPWMARRSNQSILKEINPEYSLEGTDAEGEAPILWPPDVKNWLIGKDANAGKDWRQEEKGTKEDEMVGWHHWHEFE